VCKTAAKATLVRIQPGPLVRPACRSAPRADRFAPGPDPGGPSPPHCWSAARRGSENSVGRGSERYLGDMRGPGFGARRARFGSGVLVGRAAVALSACTGSGYQYVKNGSNGSGTYFKVPNAWRIYDENAFVKSRHLSPTKAKAARDDSWTVAFDASAKPSLKHFNELATKQPFGI